MNQLPCLEKCAGVTYHHSGLRGKNSGLTKLMFVLNRADERINQGEIFSSAYEGAFRYSKTGVTIHRLLAYCGMTMDDIYLTNLFKCIFKDDRTPTIEEYRKCKEVLEKQVLEFNPVRIVAFGSAVGEMLRPDTGVSEDGLFYLGRFPIHYSKHPSAIWALRNKNMVREEYEKIRRFLEPLPKPL